MKVVEDLGNHNVEDNIGTDCSDSEDAEQGEHNSLLCHNTIDIFFDTKGHRLLPEEAIEVEHHCAEHGVPIATDLEEHLGHNELVEHRHCECCVEREEPKEKLLLVQVELEQISCRLEDVGYPSDQLLHEADW